MTSAVTTQTDRVLHLQLVQNSSLDAFIKRVPEELRAEIQGKLQGAKTDEEAINVLSMIVCKQFRPLKRYDLELAAHKLLQSSYGVKDPQKTIDVCAKFLLSQKKQAAMVAAYEKAFDSIQKATAVDAATRRQNLLKLHAALRAFSHDRNDLLEEIDAQVDALDSAIGVQLQLSQELLEQADEMSARIQGIRLVSSANAADITTLADKATK